MNLPYLCFALLCYASSSTGFKVNPMDVRFRKSPAVIEDVADGVTAVIRAIAPLVELLNGRKDPHEAYPKVVFATW